MLEDILLLLALLWFFTTFGIAGMIITNVEENNYKIEYLIALKKFLIKLFSGRNWFGIIMSIFVLIISIPAILIVLMLQILLYFLMEIRYIWCLGDK